MCRSFLKLQMIHLKHFACTKVSRPSQAENYLEIPVAIVPNHTIVHAMTLDRLIKQAGLALCLVVLTVGCSGISASKSFSPASFLLPGLMQNTPTCPAPLDLTTNLPPSSILAQAQ
jgi:hypothetical protein